MNALLNQLSEYLWHQSWQVSLLIGVAFILSHALRRKSAHLRYMVWLVVLAKCLVPPVFHVPVPLLPAQTIMQSSQTRGILDFDPEALNPVPEKTVSSEPTKASWYSHGLALMKRHWAIMGWALIAILVYVISAFRMIRIRRSLYSHRTPVSEPVQTDLDLVCNRYGVTKRPAVWLLAQTSQPFVWGWLKGAIYLPDEFESKDAEHRKAILAHELGHVSRYDAAINLFQVVAQGIFWFHPLVWWANVQIRKERELCCDEMAIANLGTSAKTYCNALINALAISRSAPMPMGSLAISSPAKHIKQRIRTIMKGTQFRTHPPAMAMVSVILMALLLVSTSCSLCRKPVDVPEEYLANEEYILISALVFESTDEGEGIAGFLEEAGITPLGQSRGMSALLTTAQQERFKALPHIKKIASPTAPTKDGRAAKLSVIYEEYFRLDPNSTEEPTSFKSGLELEVIPHLQETEHNILLNIDLEVFNSSPSPNSLLPTITRSKVSNTCMLNRNTGILLVGQPQGDELPLSMIIQARTVLLSPGWVEPTE